MLIRTPLHRLARRGRPAWLPALVLACWSGLVACGPKPPPAEPPPLWEEGDETVPDLRREEAAPTKSPGKSAQPAPKAPPSRAAKPTDDEGPSWSILIASFTQPDHAEAARAARDRLAAQFPQIADCVVRRVSKGSVIVLGKYSGPNDPEAQDRLKKVKAITVDRARPFAGVLLTRVSVTDENRKPSPYDIRHLRDLNPDINPLYTLQVAAWSTFGDASLKWSQVRAAAEKYCGELRAKGFLAFVHHDDDRQISSVTVGAFGKDAYDPRSTLFDPEVEDLMKKFPKHLVNGEEVLVPIDPRKPDGPTKPQGPRLVEVPK
jgi:cell division septation protein DedD